jgi:hypothetical protein
MADDFQYDVFLSHSAKDKAVVRPLAERLRKNGLNVWPVLPKPPRVGGFDEWVLKPGDSIPAKIEEGLELSRVMGCPAVASLRRRKFCMSAQAFGSDWAQLPTHPQPSTLNSQPVCARLNQERRFIPLLAEPSASPS